MKLYEPVRKQLLDRLGYGDVKFGQGQNQPRTDVELQYSVNTISGRANNPSAEMRSPSRT